MFAKLISPGDGRRSRLHNARNARVSMGRLIRNGPRALATFTMLKLADYRPVQPWISYDAIAALDALLTRSMVVLEYGSGMSTEWIARRVASVTSVDDHPEWVEFQKKRIQSKSIANAHIFHASTESEYVHPAVNGEKPKPQSFDFILIDGRYRNACAVAALDLIKPGGIIYLDNSDIRQFNDLDGNLDLARELLTKAVHDRGGSVEEFVDFCPGQLFVTAGHLFRL